MQKEPTRFYFTKDDIVILNRDNVQPWAKEVLVEEVLEDGFYGYPKTFDPTTSSVRWSYHRLFYVFGQIADVKFEK